MSQPILDDDYSEKEVINKALTQNIRTRVILYFVIMLAGGSILLGLRFFAPYLFVFSFLMSLLAILLSLVLEAIRYSFRKRRERKSGIKEIRDPFWFEVLEGGFSIWILMILSVMINVFVL